MSTKTLTIGEVRAWIEGHGLTYASVATQIGVDKSDLNKVLSGFVQCRRGAGHRIGVSLRIKIAPPDFDGDFVLPTTESVRKWLRENDIKPIPHPRSIAQIRHENQ